MSPPAAGLSRAPGADSAALLTHWIMTAWPPAPRRRRQRASFSRRPSPGPVRRILPAGAVMPRSPRPLASGPALGWYDLILISLSGGKDSQTALRQVVLAADAARIPRSRIVCVYADLGPADEWPGARELAARHAAHYGLRFIVTCRLVAGADGRPRPQALLEHIWNRGLWPDGRNRYCTSDAKRGPIRAIITRLVTELRESGIRGRRVRVLNVMGMRAEESLARRVMAPFGPDKASNLTVRQVDYWLPLHSWSAADVWADIAASGVPYHKVYDLGMPRLSCILCPLASEAALVLSAQVNPAAAAVRAAMEREFVRRKAVVTFAAGLALYQLGGFAPGPMRLIRLAARPGALFKKNLPMAEIVALARTRPRPAVVDDWAA